MKKIKNVTGSAISFRTDNREDQYAREIVTVSPGEIKEVPFLKDYPVGLEVVDNKKVKDKPVVPKEEKAIKENFPVEKLSRKVKKAD